MQQANSKLNEIFILTKGGVTIFYHNFGFEGLDKDLRSGVMTSLRMLASEITGNELTHLRLSDCQYYFFSFDPFTLVLHVGEDYCRAEIERLAKEISQAFTLKYGTTTENQLTLEQFDSFDQDLYTLLAIEDPIPPKSRMKSSEVPPPNYFGLPTKKSVMKQKIPQKLFRSLYE